MYRLLSRNLHASSTRRRKASPRSVVDPLMEYARRSAARARPRPMSPKRSRTAWYGTGRRFAWFVISSAHRASTAAPASSPGRSRLALRSTLRIRMAASPSLKVTARSAHTDAKMLVGSAEARSFHARANAASRRTRPLTRASCSSARFSNSASASTACCHVGCSSIQCSKNCVASGLSSCCFAVRRR
jgi:hypothetical protein